MIPLPSLITLKLAGAALAIAAAFASGWSVNGWRIHSATQAQELARSEQAIQDERENRRTESLRQKNVIEAQNAQNKRNQGLALDAAANRSAVAGLSGDLEAVRAELSGRTGDACPDYAAAADQLLGAVETGVARLSQRGADIAAKADGHASDYQTLADGWAK